MLTVEELNDRLIDLAFAEDIGDGDHTTLCCIPADAMGKSKLLIKEEGILAGIEIAKEVFLSSPAVSNRIEKLEHSGILTGYHAQMNALLFGYNIKAFINLEVQGL